MSDAPMCPGRMTVSNTPCGDAGRYELAGIWLCDHHYWRVLAKALDLQRREIARGCATCAERAERDEWPPVAAEVVYYLQRPDGLIKIGFTAVFRRRLGRLRAEHGPMRVLLTHQGGYECEQAMHLKFRALRAEGEFFRPGRRLMAWIIEVRWSQDPKAVFPETLPLAEVEALAASKTKTATKTARSPYRPPSRRL